MRTRLITTRFFGTLFIIPCVGLSGGSRDQFLLGVSNKIQAGCCGESELDFAQSVGSAEWMKSL